MEVELRNNEIFLFVEKEIYNEDVLHKCFYWYGGDFSVDISAHTDKIFLVRLKSNSTNPDLQVVVEKIKRDLIDFKLRDIVTKETKTVRELIVAKAFAYYGLNNDPSTEITDPVGFDPQRVKSNGGDSHIDSK
jgi:His-Xaa-Ser system protein HxsD